MIDATGGTNSIKHSVAVMSATGVFVINLYASMTPMPSVPKSLKGYESYRLYQVSKVEDGRHRYRLRLGFFNSEADAEIALASLRSLYPAAFTSRAGAEDMRFAGDPLLTGRFEARPAAPVAAAVASAAAVPKLFESKSVKQSPVIPVVAAAPKPVIRTESQSMKAAHAELTAEMTKVKDANSLVVQSKARSTPFTMTTHQPFHVARGVDLPDTNLELAPTIIPAQAKKKIDAVPEARLQPPASKPTAVPQASVAPKANVGVTKAAPVSVALTSQPSAAAINAAAAKKVSAPVQQAKPTPKSVAAVAKPAAKVAPPIAIPAPALVKPASKNSDDYVPILDTTMTIRAITVAEIEDENKPKWFAVQLALSEQPFNLDAMPRLDIFAAYRLYSVIVDGAEEKNKYSLRLGFFREEVSADAVAGYLKTFFPAPVITRIAIAEYDRFIEPKAVPSAPVIVPNVVVLDEKRDQGAAPSKPTFGVTPAPTPVRAPATAPVNAKPKSNQQKWETTQPGYRSGPSGKYSIDKVKKGQAGSATSESAIRQASRPGSFFSKLIGRELD